MRLPSRTDLEAELCSRSLSAFVRMAWPIMEPGRPLYWNWHMDAICQHLQAMYEGQLRKLIINVPPRSTKTTICVASNAWRWINKPEAEFICISHADDIALRDAVAARNLIESRWFQERFGPIKMINDQNQKGRFENTYRGGRVSTGILAGGTGENADHILVDDPHDVTSALSEMKRPSQVESYISKWSNRLNDPKAGTQCIIGQRTHEDDLFGRCISDGGWEHLVIPMEFDDSITKVTGIGWSDPRSEMGELLDPERFGEKEVEEYRRKGTLYYATQYQQNPAPAVGVIIKRAWIRYWKPANLDLPPVEYRDEEGNIQRAIVVNLPEKFDKVSQSWDLTFKGKTTSDRVAGVTGAFSGTDCYLIDGEHGVMDFVTTLDAILKMRSRWPDCRAVYIEDKANGPAVMNTLADQIPALIAIEPEGGKESRVWAVQCYFRGGNVYLPHPALTKWGQEAENELVKFPQAKHDDLVDAITQILNEEMTTLGSFSIDVISL